MYGVEAVRVAQLKAESRERRVEVGLTKWQDKGRGMLIVIDKLQRERNILALKFAYMQFFSYLCTAFCV